MNKHIHLTLAFIWLLPVLLNAQSGEWKNMPPLPDARGGAVAVFYQDQIFVLGGKSLNNRVLNTVAHYDLNSAVWDTTSIPAFSQKRYNAAAVVFEDKIYLFGGFDDHHALKSCEIYDPVQNTWSAAHGMRKEREGLAGMVFNNQIFALGGQHKNEMQDKIEYYAPNEDNWFESEFELPDPRAAFFHAVSGDTLFLLGGSYYGPRKSIFHTVPEDSSYEWQESGSLSVSRAYGGSATVGHKLFMLGGETYQGKTDLVEIFDLHIQELVTGRALRSPRSGMATAVINDSLVVVIGGFETEFDVPVATVESFNPAPTALEEDLKPNLPQSQVLLSGYPNPFNGQMQIQLKITRRNYYEIKLYDVSGRYVSRLANRVFNSGSHKLLLNAPPTMASGIYFVVASGPQTVQKMKIAYVK